MGDKLQQIFGPTTSLTLRLYKMFKNPGPRWLFFCMRQFCLSHLCQLILFLESFAYLEVEAMRSFDEFLFWSSSMPNKSCITLDLFWCPTLPAKLLLVAVESLGTFESCDELLPAFTDRLSPLVSARAFEMESPRIIGERIDKPIDYVIWLAMRYS